MLLIETNGQNKYDENTEFTGFKLNSLLAIDCASGWAAFFLRVT